MQQASLVMVEFVTTVMDPREPEKRVEYGGGRKDFYASDGYELTLADGVVSVTADGLTGLYPFAAVRHALAARDVPDKSLRQAIDELAERAPRPEPLRVTLDEPLTVEVGDLSHVPEGELIGFRDLSGGITTKLAESFAEPADYAWRELPSEVSASFTTDADLAERRETRESAGSMHLAAEPDDDERIGGATVAGSHMEPTITAPSRAESHGGKKHKRRHR